VNIAIVGSREWADLDQVREIIRLIASEHPEAVIVSGGAKGVDETAESAALACGLQARSYRVRTLDVEKFGIEEWVLGGEHRTSYIREMHEEPTWANYESALFYRNSLIVEKADRVVAFWNGYSRGTALAVDFAHGHGKPCKVYLNDKPFRMPEVISK
jgi:hypothetical protein